MQAARIILLSFYLAASHTACASDITQKVLGSFRNFLPVAFGDYNNDQQTDVFLLNEDRSMLEVAIMDRMKLPMMQHWNLTCSYQQLLIITLMPSDYDGDGVMDILVVARNTSETDVHKLVVFALWGDLTALHCLRSSYQPLLMLGQPLAFDYDGDMATDLLAMTYDGRRVVWQFSRGRSAHMLPLSGGRLRLPATHAFADLTGDLRADLLLATQSGFEQMEHTAAGWTLKSTNRLPSNLSHIGQPVLLDLTCSGLVQVIVPVCLDVQCVNSSLLLRSADGWLDVPLVLESSLDGVWGFPVPAADSVYGQVIVLRVGDVNLDGFPDIIVSLDRKDGETGSLRSFILKNIECPAEISCLVSRAFLVQWNPLEQWSLSPAAAFFDVGDDGLLDVLVMHQVSGHHTVSVYGNEPGQDALFLKLTVIDGGCYHNCSHGVQVAYGTNRPGPAALGHVTLTDGSVRAFSGVQLAQSAHQALQLPYTVFGLGRSPNFVDSLEVGVPRVSDVSSKDGASTRSWTQLIPNSQLIVIPHPPDRPSQWINKLYVTPGQTIISTLGSLLATLAAVVVIIIALHWRERRQDKLERMQQAHRFNFDAM